MAIPRRSRFVYDVTTWTTSLPVRAWTPVDSTVGGWKDAASGTPAAYIVRRDSLLTVTLRLTEVEWLALLDLIAFGQTAQAFTWYPDVNDLSTSFQVYLKAPAPGDTYTPTRDGQYPRTIEASLTLRSVDGTPLWLDYFET